MSPSSTEETAAVAAPRRLEHLASELGIPAHVVAGVMAARRWDAASEVTSDELQAAIDEVASIRITTR